MHSAGVGSYNKILNIKSKPRGAISAVQLF